MSKLIKKMFFMVIIANFLIGCSFGQQQLYKQGNDGEKKASSKNEDAVAATITKEVFSPSEVEIQDVEAKVKNSEFWANKLESPNKVIMTYNEINGFNDETRKKVNTVYKLEEYKTSLSKEEVSSYITAYKIPTSNLYDSEGNLITKKFIVDLDNNRNLVNLKKDVKAEFGVAIKRTSVRGFPTDVGVYSKKNSTQIDRFQETSCDICEPVIILYRSLDNKWLFIQNNNYRGWVKSEDIAIEKDKDKWIQYCYGKEFLIVTASFMTIKENLYRDGENAEFYMGDRIPLVQKDVPKQINGKTTEGAYVVELPNRKEDGSLEVKYFLIPKDGDVSVGYIPYTRWNIIKQAFKFQGDNYDWGNKKKGEDCSSFINCIYKVFGFVLPRNTDEQMKTAGISYNFTGDNIKERESILCKLKPGAAIYMNGHVVMYLGQDNGKNYLIQDFSGYAKKEAGGLVYQPIYKVAVTTTNLPMADGTPYGSRFIKAIEMER